MEGVICGFPMAVVATDVVSIVGVVEIELEVAVGVVVGLFVPVSKPPLTVVDIVVVVAIFSSFPFVVGCCVVVVDVVSFELSFFPSFFGSEVVAFSFSIVGFVVVDVSCNFPSFSLGVEVIAVNFVVAVVLRASSEFSIFSALVVGFRVVVVVNVVVADSCGFDVVVSFIADSGLVSFF